MIASLEHWAGQNYNTLVVVIGVSVLGLVSAAGVTDQVERSPAVELVRTPIRLKPVAVAV